VTSCGTRTDCFWTFSFAREATSSTILPRKLESRITWTSLRNQCGWKKVSPRGQWCQQRLSENLEGVISYPCPTLLEGLLSWLLVSVKRRFLIGHYSEVRDFVTDVRLVFENCYRYFGRDDPHTKKALKIEQFYLQKVAALPK